MNLRDSLSVACSIVAEARQHLLSIPRTELQVQKKEDNSFVTRADTETETFIREQLEAHFPDHGILGEEFPDKRTDSSYTWVIDPIDGTHSFKHNIPLYGIILCLMEGDDRVLSVIDLPALDRRYSAARGLGTSLNGASIHISDLMSDEQIDEEVIGTGERRAFLSCGKETLFDRLMLDHAHVRTYCDCFGHTLAAEGTIGVMLDFNIRLWDCAGSILLVEEAGGKAVCLEERQDGAYKRYDWVFGKPRMVDWVLDTFLP